MFTQEKDYRSSLIVSSTTKYTLKTRVIFCVFIELYNIILFCVVFLNPSFDIQFIFLFSKNTQFFGILYIYILHHAIVNKKNPSCSRVQIYFLQTQVFFIPHIMFKMS